MQFNFDSNEIDVLSAPQLNTSLGGGNGTSVSGGSIGGNGDSEVPGSGYPDEYYEAHSNDTSPTSPSVSSGSLNAQNATQSTNICDCNQQGGSDNGNSPGGDNTNAPGGTDVGNTGA